MKTLFWYRLKCIVRDRANMFWTLVFPILLGTMFFFAFGQLVTNEESFKAIPIAVVEKRANESFSETLAELAEGDDPFLDARYMDEQEALALLESDTVDGIYYVDETPTLTVKAEGLMQSMLRSVLDGYVQITSTVTEVAQKDPALVADAVEKLTDPAPALEEVSLSGGSMDYMRENFYSLIAMTCLYASFFGLSGAMSAQANLSPLGARRSISPTKKMALAWSDILAAVLVMFAVVLVLIAFLNALPNLDFGENLPYLLLTVLVGVFVGVMYGMLVGVAVRGSRTAKEGILIGLTLVLCFLSGLMATNMRYAVDKVAPIINSVNPAALLVDSFYTMETYGIGERFWVNIGTLAIIGALFSVLSVAILRRKQYASI